MACQTVDHNILSSVFVSAQELFKILLYPGKTINQAIQSCYMFPTMQQHFDENVT
jgi:hypothetical protein